MLLPRLCGFSQSRVQTEHTTGAVSGFLPLMVSSNGCPWRSSTPQSCRTWAHKAANDVARKNSFPLSFFFFLKKTNKQKRYALIFITDRVLLTNEQLEVFNIDVLLSFVSGKQVYQNATVWEEYHNDRGSTPYQILRARRNLPGKSISKWIRDPNLSYICGTSRAQDSQLFSFCTLYSCKGTQC